MTGGWGRVVGGVGWGVCVCVTFGSAKPLPVRGAPPRVSPPRLPSRAGQQVALLRRQPGVLGRAPRHEVGVGGRVVRPARLLEKVLRGRRWGAAVGARARPSLPSLPYSLLACLDFGHVILHNDVAGVGRAAELRRGGGGGGRARARAPSRTNNAIPLPRPPTSTSRAATSACPIFVAQCHARSPALLEAPTFAPAAVSTRTPAAHPSYAAECRGVLPAASTSLTSAPAAMAAASAKQRGEGGGRPQNNGRHPLAPPPPSCRSTMLILVVARAVQGHGADPAAAGVAAAAVGLAPDGALPLGVGAGGMLPPGVALHEGERGGGEAARGWWRGVAAGAGARPQHPLRAPNPPHRRPCSPAAARSSRDRPRGRPRK